ALTDRASTKRRWSNCETGPERPLRIGVIALPHMANFTDFDALAMEPSVSLAFLERPEEMAAADILVLPGSKQTLQDLDWLNCRGLAQKLRRLSEDSVPIIGICGGFQMLGSSIEDPNGVENQGKSCERNGLGLFPVQTVLGLEKTVRRVHGFLRTNFF